jgi:yecA family protein
VNEVTAGDYTVLETALESAGAECGAAESHGLLCGMICASGKVEEVQWLEQVLGEGNTLSAAAQAARDLLVSLYSRSLLQLNDIDLGLELLLPDDEALLFERSTALGEWCQGFLYGLAMGGVRDDPEPTGHVAEIMHDMFEISQARPEQASSEEEESAYMEVAEYVRMCVLLCHEELQPIQTPERLQ